MLQSTHALFLIIPSTTPPPDPRIVAVVVLVHILLVMIKIGTLVGRKNFHSVEAWITPKNGFCISRKMTWQPPHDAASWVYQYLSSTSI